ncbi:hypothetical protein TELCIR_22710 [Teladorsagia circumcincta]|uniref:Uncharacterized protein n=1 Tax=Teladorsagia circumcincta TaxID=45464 RepID=A0A2G9TD44_TELCI|nr:hypothetical protein TELCIR_22710 [Teladorsagia circumcincta]
MSATGEGDDIVASSREGKVEKMVEEGEIIELDVRKFFTAVRINHGKVTVMKSKLLKMIGAYDLREMLSDLEERVTVLESKDTFSDEEDELETKKSKKETRK